MQEAVQADRLPEAVGGRVEPRGAERPPPDPDGGARALLRAAPSQVVLLGRRRRRVRRRRRAVAAVHLQRQRGAELVRVPAARQLRVAAAGEPGAEAGDLADAGAADGAGAGAGADEAAGDPRRGRAARGARTGVPGVAVEGVRARADNHVRRAGGGGGGEAEEEELPELAGVGGQEPEAAEGVLGIRLKKLRWKQHWLHCRIGRWQ